MSLPVWKSLIITRLMKHVNVATKSTKRRKNRNVFGSHKESAVIRRDDCAFDLEVAVCGLNIYL